MTCLAWQRDGDIVTAMSDDAALSAEERAERVLLADAAPVGAELPGT